MVNVDGYALFCEVVVRNDGIAEKSKRHPDNTVNKSTKMSFFILIKFC